MGFMPREKSVGHVERPSPTLPGFPHTDMRRSTPFLNMTPVKPLSKITNPLDPVSVYQRPPRTSLSCIQYRQCSQTASQPNPWFSPWHRHFLPTAGTRSINERTRSRFQPWGVGRYGVQESFPLWLRFVCYIVNVDMLLRSRL